MSHASHLGIKLGEYDAVIRTLIPHYEALLDAVAAVVETCAPAAPEVVDLGTGTGALAARVLAVRPKATLTGVDEDPHMLDVARRRLRGRLTPIEGSFERVPLPRSDLATASFALHHVRTKRRKLATYARVAAALRRGGLLVTGDNCLATDPTLRAEHRARWLAHLTATYSKARAERFLADWAKEDVYFSLDDELAMIRAAGLRPDVAWRRDSFAVIVGVKAGAIR